jgi:hypothetical protein
MGHDACRAIWRADPPMQDVASAPDHRVLYEKPPLSDRRLLQCHARNGDRSQILRTAPNGESQVRHRYVDDMLKDDGQTLVLREGLAAFLKLNQPATCRVRHRLGSTDHVEFGKNGF